MAGNLLAACTALLPPGTQLRYAWTAQTGLKPTWRYLTYWLMLFSHGRVVAVADDYVYVFKTGRTRFSFTKPRALAFSVPRADVTPATLRGSWTRVPIGAERMWVSRRVYPLVGTALGSGARA